MKLIPEESSPNFFGYSGKSVLINSRQNDSKLIHSNLSKKFDQNFQAIPKATTLLQQSIQRLFLKGFSNNFIVLKPNLTYYSQYIFLYRVAI